MSSRALSGDTAVIGAPPDGGSGAVYVFVRNGMNWEQQARLSAADRTPGDRFGEDVAVDGDTVVVGAPRNSENGFFSGAAYVFVRNGTTWTQQQKLTAPDAAAEDQFGRSVAISGNTVLVGGVQ